MPRNPEPLRRAERFLERLTEEQPPDRSTSIAVLAAQAGVSYSTMWRAARRFKAAGRLHGDYRVQTGPSGQAPVHEEPVRPPAVRLEERMTGDILSGAIVRNGRMISVKELIARYGTSARTLRRVSQHLAHQGLLLPQGRGYRRTGVSHRQRPRIVLIAYTFADSGLVLPALETEFLRAAEIACIDSEASLEVAVVRPRGTKLAFTDYAGARDTALPRDKDIAGYIYMIDAVEAFDNSVMRSILSTRKPVVILDQAGAFPYGRKDYDLPRLRIFTASGGQRPGKEMARYLLSKGHHHLAFISPFHADTWSQNRSAGVRKIAAMAGEGFSLAEFTRALSAKGEDYQDEGREQVPVEELKRLLALLRKKGLRAFREDIDVMQRDRIPSFYMDIGVRSALEILLEKACREKEITAWIMANDQAARIACQYCRRKHIDIPERIAIVGFDDTVESSTERTTSYNYGFNAVALAIARFLLHPLGEFWSKRRIVEIGGKVVGRESG